MRVVNFRISRLVLAAGVVIGAVLHSAVGKAHDYRVGSLRIDHPWATATPQGAKVGVGYITIINDGSQADRLISVTSPAARKVTIHASVKEGDVVKMRPLDKGLEIKAGETVEIETEWRACYVRKLCGTPARSRAPCRGHAVFRESRQHRCGFHH